jgi:hypothetical protein
MLFKKKWFGKFGLKIDKILKKSPQKTKKHKMLYLTWKVGFLYLFYCVKHIHGQFKTYLKLRSIHFKQIAKTIPTFGNNLAVIFFKIHFILYAIDFPICTMLFILICHVFIVLYGVLTAVLCFRNLQSKQCY